MVLALKCLIGVVTILGLAPAAQGFSWRLFAGRYGTVGWLMGMRSYVVVNGYQHRGISSSLAGKSAWGIIYQRSRCGNLVGCSVHYMLIDWLDPFSAVGTYYADN
jgi:hypothetical protein